jgi:hypothetical protein
MLESGGDFIHSSGLELTTDGPQVVRWYASTLQKLGPA